MAVASATATAAKRIVLNVSIQKRSATLAVLLHDAHVVEPPRCEHRDRRDRRKPRDEPARQRALSQLSAAREHQRVRGDRRDPHAAAYRDAREPACTHGEIRSRPPRERQEQRDESAAEETTRRCDRAALAYERQPDDREPGHHEHRKHRSRERVPDGDTRTGRDTAVPYCGERERQKRRQPDGCSDETDLVESSFTRRRAGVIRHLVRAHTRDESLPPHYWMNPPDFRKSSATACADSPLAWMRPLSSWSFSSVSASKTGLSSDSISGYLLGDLGARYGRGPVDELRTLVVRKHHEAELGQSAVRTVRHADVHAVGAVGNCLLGLRGVTAGKDDAAVLGDVEAVRRLERRPGIRVVEELVGGGDLDLLARASGTCPGQTSS